MAGTFGANVQDRWVTYEGDSQAKAVLEKGTGNPLFFVRMASASDVADGAAQARTAQEAWFSRPFEDRATVLRKAADLIEKDRNFYVDWIVRETGSVPAKAEFEIVVVIRALREAAAMPSQPQGLVLPTEPGKLSFCRRMPLGVVGVISPFNFPMYLSMRAVAPALAVGNAVILKPDPRTTATGGLLIGSLFASAGLPDGVLQVLPGEAEAGEAMCTDPNVAMIQFTGSTGVGRRIGALAGGHLKKVSLELGGKNSLIVLDDADLELAAANAAWASFLHQGQICMAAGRILVQRSVHDQLAELIARKAEALPVGDPAREQTALGPLINATQAERAHGIVADTIAAGAILAAGGDLVDAYLKPAVLTGVTPKMRAFHEEIFGPVAVLVPFDSDEEAIALANDTEYGLSAGIISRSVGRAMRLGARLRTGLLHINDQTVGDEVVNPFGGRGQSGNGTSIGGPANWDEFSQWQWVTVRDVAPAYPF